MNSPGAAIKAAELLKALRAGEVKRVDLSAATGIGLRGVEYWLDEWERHGIVVRKGPRGRTAVYTLSSNWGG